MAAAVAHAVRGAPSRLRARARGHDERRGGQRAAQDARGAAVLRRAAPAHGQARRRCCRRSPAAASRCASTRRRPTQLAQTARSTRASRRTPREAAARLSLGDGEKALALATGDGPKLRARRRDLARAPLHGTGSRAALACACSTAREARGPGREDEVEQQLEEELQYLPEEGAQAARDGVHRTRAPRRAPRATTQALDHALQLAGLWYRDLGVPSPRTRPSSSSTPTARHELAAGRRPRRHNLQRAQELVDDTRAALILNVSEELACEALAYRLEEALSSSSSSA